MIRTIIALTLLAVCAQAFNTTFENCSEKGVIKFVNVEPCNSDPCTFEAGQEVHLNGVLVSPATSASPKLQPKIKLGGVWINYPGFDTDACKYTDCPIKADVDTPFALTLNVISTPVPMEVPIKFSVLDTDGSELNCGQTVVKVE